MKIDQLKDFNEVVHFYNLILQFTSNIKLNPKNLKEITMAFILSSDLCNLSVLASFRILASNISLYISQLQEQTEFMNNQELFDSKFPEVESLANITGKKGELSVSDKKRQIRNCLAHADYHIVLDNFKTYDFSNQQEESSTATIGEIGLYLENDSIKGVLTFPDLLEISQKYTEAFAYMKHGNDVLLLVRNPVHKTFMTMDDYVDSSERLRITRNRDNSGISFDKLKYRVMKLNKAKSWWGDSRKAEDFLDYIREDFTSFHFSEEPLTKEGKEFLGKYLRYVGLNNMVNNPYTQQAFNQMNAANNEHVLPIDILTKIFMTMDSFRRNRSLLEVNFEYSKDEKVLEDLSRNLEELMRCNFQAPIIFANTVLGLTNYMLGYTKEINEQNGFTYFDYRNIGNLNGLTATVREGNNTKQVPLQVNPLDKLQNRLHSVNGNISSLRKQKSSKDKQKESLDNPKNKNPRKQEILDEINHWQETVYDSQMPKAMAEKDSLLKQIDECSKDGETLDSSEFFRHLRNSMAHGNYTISYGELTDLTHIVYHFEDKDEIADTSYKIDLQVEQLVKILEAFQVKINECSKDYFDGKQMERDIVKYAIEHAGVGKDDVTSEIFPKDEKLQNVKAQIEKEKTEEQGDGIR